MRPVNTLRELGRCAAAYLHTCHQPLLASIDGQREAGTTASSARADAGEDTVEANQAMLAGTGPVPGTQQPANADNAIELKALT